MFGEKKRTLSFYYYSSNYIRVTNAGSESQRNVVLKLVLTKQEREKKREYNKRIMNIEHGTFTPLIFTIHRGMGPECAAYH